MLYVEMYLIKTPAARQAVLHLIKHELRTFEENSGK